MRPLIISLAMIPIFSSGLFAQPANPHARKNTREALRALKNADKRHQRIMVQELMKTDVADEADRKALLDTLGDLDPETEVAVVSLLGKAKERRAVPKLIGNLKNKNHDVKLASMDALAEIGDERAIAPLEDTLSEQLHFGRPNPISKFGAKALPRLIKKGDETFIKNPKTKADHDRRQQHRLIARTIGEIRDPAAKEDLVKLLSSQSSDMKINAARSLMTMKMKEAEPAVAELLNDEDIDVKTKTIGMLLPIDTPRYLPSAIEFLQNKQSPLRGQTAEVIGNLKVAEAVPALEKLLTDPTDTVRYRSAKALKKITGKDYEYKKTRFTEKLERSSEEWKLLNEGRYKEFKPNQTNIESDDERRQATEKLRQKGLMAE